MKNNIISLSQISTQLNCPISGTLSSKGMRCIGIMTQMQISFLKLAEFFFLTQGCYLGASFKGWLSNIGGKPCFEFDNSQHRAKPLILQQRTATSGGRKCVVLSI